MAVVFISPKKRQKMFFMGITAMFLFLMVAVALLVFLSQPAEVSSQLVFNKPKVSVNLDIFNSEQFKNLELFGQMEMEFSYTATTTKGKTVQGKVSAASEDDARKILGDEQLSVTDIKLLETGRDNPFVPYYQTVVPVPTIKTK